jgi:hypothetical protein
MDYPEINIALYYVGVMKGPLLMRASHSLARIISKGAEIPRSPLPIRMNVIFKRRELQS